jgi:hypothetical protein
VFSQSLNSYYQTIVSNTSPDTLYHHLISFQNFGVKRIPSTALNNTANWIIGKYQSFGYTDIVRDTFSYSGNELYNIVVTKQGTVFPDKYLIIDSHYDTYNNYIQHSPGANDNGSGVTAMLEIARLLSGVNTAYSIKFITFSAEEVGLVGSQHYVSEVVRTSNMDILLVFNIDEVGGQNGVNNTTINCESDQSAPTYSNVVSADYTDTLSNITELYSTLSTSITNAYGSDYMSFQKDSIVITGFYEYPTSSHYHKTTDIVANMNLPYFYQVTKASVASALYFAKAYQVFTEVDRNSISTGIIVYPNPVSDFLKIIGLTDEKYNLLISDFTGRLIISKQVSGKSCFVDTKQMNSGVFSYSICDMSGRIVKSGKLVRIK